MDSEYDALVERERHAWHEWDCLSRAALFEKAELERAQQKYADFQARYQAAIKAQEEAFGAVDDYRRGSAIRKHEATAPKGNP